MADTRCTDNPRAESEPARETERTIEQPSEVCNRNNTYTYHCAFRECQPGADRPLGRGERIFVRDGERCWFVPVERIALIEADGNYAQLTFDGERAMIARSLGAIADRLDPALFFRANRQQIINLDFVESLVPWPNDGYLVRLAGGREIEMSRRQARLFHAARRL